jgi:hypothetical protein
MDEVGTEAESRESARGAKQRQTTKTRQPACKKSIVKRKKRKKKKNKRFGGTERLYIASLTAVYPEE